MFKYLDYEVYRYVHVSCQNYQKLNWNCGIILQVMAGGGGYNFSSLGQGGGGGG